jgi:hypothetical protein
MSGVPPSLKSTPSLSDSVHTTLQEKKKKYEPPAPPPRVGKKQKKRDQASSLGTKLPTIAPNAKCKLRLLKLERVKDYLLMEEEFVKTQELLKPHEERNEEERTKVRSCSMHCWHTSMRSTHRAATGPMMLSPWTATAAVLEATSPAASDCSITSSDHVPYMVHSLLAGRARMVIHHRSMLLMC